MATTAKSRPDPLAFPPLMTLEEFQKCKEVSDGFTVHRNLTFASFLKGGHDTAQIAWNDGDFFLELMEHAMDYKAHLEKELELTNVAVARFIAVGQELSKNGKPEYVTEEPKAGQNS